MKQMVLFENPQDANNNKYTKKVEIPIYEPRHIKPHILLLYDQTKTAKLIREIDASNLPDEEKAFLRAAAWRHTVFHYKRIADYYAHSTVEMQRLMEQSALVIIDFESALERGFIRLTEDIRIQYLEEYGGDAKPIT